MGKAGTNVWCTKMQILFCMSKVLTCYNVGLIPPSICLFNRYWVNLECARHCAKCWGLNSEQNTYDPSPGGTENPVGKAPDNKALMIMCERGRRKGYPSLRGRSWESGWDRLWDPLLHLDTMLGRWKSPLNPVWPQNRHCVDSHCP